MNELDEEQEQYTMILHQLMLAEFTARGYERVQLALRAGAIARLLRRKKWRTDKQWLHGRALVACAEQIERKCLTTEPGSPFDPE